MKCSAGVIILTLLIFSHETSGKIEGHIVGGDFADITDFPHSAFMLGILVSEGRAWRCGASILNQRILLTAAHCIGMTSGVEIYVNVGHQYKDGGTRYTVSKYRRHEQYAERRVVNDIALLMVNKNIAFSNKVKRVSILRSPPKAKQGSVAGWGLVDELYPTLTNYLKKTDLPIRTRDECIKYLYIIPKRVLCAGSFRGDKYVSGGDSGSALMIRRYLQIGLVSYKIPRFSTSLAVFTNVSDFYDWIKKSSKSLYCRHKMAV